MSCGGLLVKVIHQSGAKLVYTATQAFGIDDAIHRSQD
jgi:hypothetical protein